MGVFKATKNASTGGVFKATKNRSYDSAFVSRMEDENRESSSRLNDYITRRQSDEWMSEDDIQGYRDALERYRSSSKALSDLRRSFGSYSDEDEKQRTSYIDSIAADLDSSSSMFKSYKNADEYGAAVKAYDTQKRQEAWKEAYKGKTYKELSDYVRSVDYQKQRRMGDISDEEDDWLKNTYMKHDRSVVDTMTEDEVLKERDASRSRINKLNAELQDLEYRKRAMAHSVYTPDGYSQSDFDDKIEAKKREIENAKTGSVLYFDEDNAAVTYDSLYRVKKAENTLVNIKSDSEADSVYSALTEDKKDIELLQWLNENATAVASGPEYYTATLATPDSDEDRQKLSYLSQKYGLNLNKPANALLPEIQNLIGKVEDKYASDRDRFSSMGYDWDEISYYDKWKQDKASYAERVARDTQFGIDHPIANTIFNILAAPTQIGDYVENVKYSLKSGDESSYGLANVYDDYMTNFIKSSTSGTAQKINDDVKNWTGSDVLAWLASGAYSGVTSSMQSHALNAACVAMFGPAGQAIALGIMGTQAASNAFQDAVMNGSTNGEALATSIAAGVAEAAFEKISLENFKGIKDLIHAKSWDTSTLRDLLKSALKNSGIVALQGAVEGSEELFTDIANALADDIINGDHSSYNTDIIKYMNAGYSREEAEKMANKNWIMSVLESFYGGFIGGSMSGSLQMAANTAISVPQAIEGSIDKYNGIRNYGASIIENDNVQRLVDSAQETGSKKLRALAQKVAGVDTSATDLSEKSRSRLVRDTGRLYYGVQEEQGKSLTQAARSDFSAKVREELSKNGVEDIDKASEAVIRYAEGKELSRSQRSMFDAVDGERVIRTVQDSTMGEKTADAYGKKLSSAALPFVSREDTELGGKKHVDVRDRVSSTGYTVNADTGENITVNKDNAIARIENGEAYINTDKGTVKLSNIEFSNENEARLYESFLDYDPATASALIKNYDGRISVERYVDGMRQGINVYGKYNFQGVGIDISKDSYFADLSPTDQRFALNIGRSIARAEAQAAQMAVASKTAVKTKGKVQFADGVTAETKAQKNGVALAKHLASALGINITFFDSTKDVQHRNDNGWYDPATDSIHLDINAGDNHEGTIAYTIGHELTHFIKKWSPEKFKVFGDFLVEQYGKHGISTQEMLEAQMAKLNTTDEAIAYEEMVADACQTMLLDSNAVEKLIQLRQQDKGLFEKIKEFIHNILDKLRKEYAGIDPNSDEAKALRSMTDVVEQMSALFEDAAVDAAQAYQSADTETIRGSQDGFVVKNDATDTGSLTGTMKSTRTERIATPKMIMPLSSGSEGKLVTAKDFPGLTATMIDGVVKGNVVNGYTVAQIREETMKANGFTSSQIKRMQAFMQSMAKFMDDAGVKYRFIGLKDVEDAKLHYTYNKDGSIKSIVLSAMVKNGDYPVNFDFSSICKKRVAMSRLINKLCGSGAIDSGTVNLTPENIFEINKAIKDAGYESACLGCFVESKRYNVQEWAKSFIKKYNSAVLKVNPNATYFSFTDGETDFDNVTASQVIAIDNAANKFLDSTGRERRNKAKSFFKENVDNGRPALAKRPKKGESYNPEEHLKPLPKSARDRLIKSESIDDITKERLLSKWNDPASISLEEAEFLVDNGIIGGRAISNKQLVTKLVESGEQFQHLLRPSDLLTEKGLSQLEQLPNFHGVLYGHYGSGTPKLVQGFTPYNSEIALLADNKGNQTLAEYLYSIAGVRMQSFSDFQIQNIFDYLQMVADLSARKLPAHAYTKEIAFAKLLGMTGIKTNLSVMFDIDPSVDNAHAGLTKYNPAIHQGEYAKIVLEDEQGKWVYNIGDYATQKAYENYDRMMGNEPVKRFLQSIGFADAVKLQTTEGYTKNCGIIGVGYSDLHILAMLDDPRIRYIIPYHASSLPQAIKIATYISKAIDYTSTQNTMKIVSITDNNGKSVDWSIKEAYKRLKSGKAVIEELNKHIKEDGWKVETKKSQNGHGSFDLYGDLSATSDPRATADNFMSWCAKNGTLPMFYQFAGHNNYYKLLYDFNVYDNVTGEYAPQQAVTNTYPTEDGSGANVVDGNFNEEFFQSMIDGYMTFQNSFNEELDSKLDEIADKITSNTLPGADFSVSVKKSSRNSSTSQMDEEYLALAKNPEKNEKRLREILYGKAKEEGFTPEHLYHGTSTFGFTKTDVSKSDDGISFFATDNIDVAQGYFPFYEDDYDSYHDSVREIGRKDKKTRKALSVYDDVSSIISSIKEMYPDEYEDARLATDDEVMSDLNDYWIPEAVEAAKSLLGYSIPKNVRELVDAVVKTYEDGSVDAWRLLSNDYKKYDEIYDIYYNGSYFFQATHLWNKVKTGLQMISKGLKYESVKNGNEIVSVATIVDRYNTSIGGENNGIYDLFARHDKQLVIRCNGSNWNNIRLGDISKEFNDWWVNEEGKDEAFISADTRTISKFAKQNGYRSVCFVDIYDSGAYGSRGDLSTVYAFFYPEEDIKSADLVTYDDNGNVIPLSERFRTDRKGRDAWKNEDIRYSNRTQPSTNNTIDQRRFVSLETSENEISKIKNSITDYETTFWEEYPEFSYRFYSRSNDGISNLGHAMFADSTQRLYGYGGDSPKVFVVKHSDLIDISNDEIRKIFRKAWDEEIESDGDITKIFDDFDEMFDSFNPEDIVDSADAWDNPECVEWVYNNVCEPNGIKGFKTEDGAVVFDSEIIGRDLIAEERFKKYSKKNKSNREILADALETTIDTSTADGEAEAAKLAEYKKHIEELDKLQIHLKEVNEEIRDLTFGNTPRDPERLRVLKEDKAKTENRIHIYDKKLLRLEATKPLKDVLEREKKRVKKETVREFRETSKEQKAQSEIKGKLKRVIKSLDQLLNHGTKERNVKADMQETVGAVLSLGSVLFNDEITNEDIVKMVAQTATPEEQKLLDKYMEYIRLRDNSEFNEALKYISKISALNRRLSELFARERERLNRTKVADAVTELSDAYERLKNSGDDFVSFAYDSDVAGRIADLKEDLGGTTVRDMTNDQLRSVYEVFRMVKHMVSTSNNLFRMGKVQSLSDTTRAVQSEVLKWMIKEHGDPDATVERVAEQFRSFGWNELKPVYAFERLGSDTYMQLFWDAINAEGVWARDVEEAKTFLDEQVRRTGYRTWDMQEAHAFRLPDGQTFKLTLQEMMSIYAYSKREKAYEHMTVGGFQFAENSEYRENGRKKLHSTGELYTVDADTIKAIIEALTPQQAAYVDAVQSYLTELGKKGNEVSRALYGIDLFTEKVYFPLMSARDYRSSVETALNATQTQAFLKNTGMSKPTVPHAKNPIILQDFDVVVNKHIDTMSKYHAYVLPIENLRRVFDSTTIRSDGRYVSTKNIIKSVYGKAAMEYFDNYITDLNGGTFIHGYNSQVMGMFSKFKATSVGASLSVIIQQPFAIIRAMNMISPQYFVFGKVEERQAESRYAEIKKYAPVAIIKEIGGFDMGNSRTAAEYLTTRTDKGLKRTVDTISKAAQWGAGKADELGWGIIWDAVKRETYKKGFKYGSKEFYEACGKRFTEVITYTQVYDSVNSRSGMMRSKHDSVKFATSFMGEPTTVINMAYSAVLKVQRAKGSAAKRKAFVALMRTAGVLLASALLNGAAKSFVYAGRDDDDDEAYFERWAEQFAGSMHPLTGDISPLTMIPYVKDIVSLFQGYDVERPDMTLIANVVSDIIRVIDKWDDMDLDTALSLIGDVGNLCGLPLKNIIRDTRGVINTIGDAFDSVYPTDIGGALMRGFSGESQSNTDALYGAIMRKDRGRIEVIRNKYKTDASYETAVKRALRENDPRITEALKARVTGDNARYQQIRKQIIEEGNFDKQIVNDALKAEYDYYMKKIEEAAKLMKEGDTVSSGDIILELKKKYKGVFKQDDIMSMVKRKAGLLK